MAWGPVCGALPQGHRYKALHQGTDMESRNKVVSGTETLGDHCPKPRPSPIIISLIPNEAKMLTVCSRYSALPSHLMPGFQQEFSLC